MGPASLHFLREPYPCQPPYGPPAVRGDVASRVRENDWEGARVVGSVFPPPSQRGMARVETRLLIGVGFSPCGHWPWLGPREEAPPGDRLRRPKSKGNWGVIDRYTEKPTLVMGQTPPLHMVERGPGGEV